jgi:parvulin-like peptidyl-prolyl isomerase
MNMKRFLSIFVFGAVLASMAFTQSDLQPVAIVRLTKSEPITVKQFRTEVENLEKQTRRTLSDSERREVLDAMINQRLILQAAERDRVTVSENEVNEQVKELRGNASERDFAIAIKEETGLDLPAFREQLRKTLLAQKYLGEKKKDLFTSLKEPAEEEIVSNYNLNRTEFVRPETVRFSIISVPFTPNNAASRAKAKADADKLAQTIGSDTAKFDEAMVKGQSPTALTALGYTGGDGGYLPRNRQAQQMVGTEFMNVAFALKQGEVSKVIENVRGYQIIKITETYEQKSLGLDDIVQLGTRMTVREYIRRSLLQQSQNVLLDRASKELITELREGNPYQIMEANIK